MPKFCPPGYVPVGTPTYIRLSEELDEHRRLVLNTIQPTEWGGWMTPLTLIQPNTDLSFDLKNAVVFDLETYPGRWCVGFRGPDAKGKITSTTVVWSQAGGGVVAIERPRGLPGWLQFGAVRRPAHSMHPGWNRSVRAAQAIIERDELPPALSKLQAFPCNHIDLSARLRRGGRFPRLKNVAANLGRPRLQELPFDPKSVS